MNAPAADLGSMDLSVLSARQGTIDRLLMAEGAGHIVHDLPLRSDGRSVGLASRPWRLDPIPYVIDADEFAWIEGAVSRRMAMLESLLDDLYGERRLVADGALDPALLWGTPGYRLSAVGAVNRRHQRRWLSTYAVDIARTVDGVWFAIADHTDTPAGLGYSLLDRRVMTQVVGDLGVGLPRPLDGMLPLVRRALVDTTTEDGPRVVVLTTGIDHPAYVDHSFLATELGFNVVEGADLVVRESQLWLQTLGGLERVDVLHRRIADRQLDPLETNTFGSAGIPAVLLADDAGSVTMANAHGTGVIEEPSLIGEWDRLGELLTGEEPWLRMRSPRQAAGSTRLDDLFGRAAERTPCLADGFLVDQPIVLRFHAVATDEGIFVVPGGNGRIVEEHDDPTVPTPARAKDLWVLGDASSRPAVDARPAPQVDFITSVPTRAAHSLYWMSRAAERSEAVARAMRVIAAAPPLTVWDGRPTPAMMVLAALTGTDAPMEAVRAAGPSLGLPQARRLAVEAAADSLEFHIGSILAEAASVREFLSTTTGRVLGEMVDTRERLTQRPDDVDALDAILFQLSAFSGLWSESVVRGPAWYYGDFAKRYERSLVAITSASVAIRIDRDTTLSADARRRGLEGVLAANDSLVAYRRRHRSDVELGAVLTLLLQDQRNPRSVSASIAGMERNAEAIGWEQGIDRVRSESRALAGIGTDVVASELDRFIDRLHAIAADLTSTRLVAPPNPTLVRSSLVDPGAVA